MGSLLISHTAEANDTDKARGAIGSDMSILNRKNNDPVLQIQPAAGHWGTDDPFLFASHHDDAYPAGNAQQAPPLDQIEGRNLGQDYRRFFGFSMYNGKVVPGFPLHAHWGYETVTVPTRGYIDHRDSLGNEGRFGFGDVQWLSAGSRYQHNEMYPLAFSDRPNPHRTTQIMLNLPLKDKNSPIGLRNFWAENVPQPQGEGWRAEVVAGTFAGAAAPAPDRVSWAADPAHRVRIVCFTLAPDARVTVDATVPTAHRNVYLADSRGATVAGITAQNHTRFKLRPDCEFEIVNGDQEAEVWLLEGNPIGERNSRFGPVVLGSDQEVREAMRTIREREMDEWPWKYVNQAQPRGSLRFIRYADGHEEHPQHQEPGETAPAAKAL